MKKEKITLFEKVEITDPEYAQKLYDKETQKFKLKLICAGISLLTSISWLLFFLLESVMPTTVEDLLLIPMAVGIIVAVVAGPITVVKTVFKIAGTGWRIIPFFLLDIVGFLFGLIFAVLGLLFVPVLYCAIILYQSYNTKKEAEAFLALDHTMSKGQTVEVPITDVNQQ